MVIKSNTQDSLAIQFQLEFHNRVVILTEGRSEVLMMWANYVDVKVVHSISCFVIVKVFGLISNINMFILGCV